MDLSEFKQIYSLPVSFFGKTDFSGRFSISTKQYGGSNPPGSWVHSSLHYNDPSGKYPLVAAGCYSAKQLAEIANQELPRLRAEFGSKFIVPAKIRVEFIRNFILDLPYLWPNSEQLSISHPDIGAWTEFNSVFERPESCGLYIIGDQIQRIEANAPRLRHDKPVSCLWIRPGEILETVSTEANSVEATNWAIDFADYLTVSVELLEGFYL